MAKGPPGMNEMQQRSVRIVIVDDHPIFRDGLCRLLAARADFEVVGVAGSGSEAVRLVAELSPDLLLLDMSMPDMSGLDVLHALQQARTSVLPVLLTASADDEDMVTALGLGARGIVLKDSATAMLYKCIDSVMQGEYWFGRDQVPSLVAAFRQASGTGSPSPAETLTRGELRVIAAVVEGATNRDVAAQLGISEQTVKNHLRHVFDKLGVSNRLELALFALHHRLVPHRRP
jgi:two-component system, NarL family, nitrate/nitrite response regulator NarL